MPKIHAKKLSKLKIVKVTTPRKIKVKPKGFPYISLFLTIGAVFAWIFAVSFTLSYLDMLNAMNAYQTKSEGWEAVVEAIFGTIASESTAITLVAITLLYFIISLAVAITLTILLIIGWKNHW